MNQYGMTRRGTPAWLEFCSQQLTRKCRERAMILRIANCTEGNDFVSTTLLKSAHAGRELLTISGDPAYIIDNPLKAFGSPREGSATNGRCPNLLQTGV